MEDRIISYKGNTYGVREVHKVLLPLLEMLDNHCKKYNISYSLAYGSLLGCVRNQGFIPWDDDVDIMMKRADFDVFLASMEKKETDLSKNCFLDCPRFMYKINSPEIEGVSVVIDIYPVDNVPNNYISEKIKYYIILLLRQTIIGRNGHMNTLFRLFRKILAYFISFFLTKHQLMNLYSYVCSWGNTKNSNRVCCYCTTNACYGRYHSSMIMNSIVYSEFEDIMMPIIERYDAYLTREYGKEYMNPPKETERHPLHNIKKK